MTPALPTPYYHNEAAGITIYHGDCQDILPHIEPGSVDLVLTDPPYGITMNTKNSDRWVKGTAKWVKCYNWDPVTGDSDPFDPAPLLRFKRAVLFGANHYASRLPDSGGWLVWDKRGEMQVESTLSEAELAWTNLGSGVRLYRHKWFGLVRDSEIGNHVHPTQKPVTLMTWILMKWSKPGDLVLDPYMGSGPVAKACQMTGRRYIGIEIEEVYCERAATRLQQSVLPMEVGS